MSWLSKTIRAIAYRRRLKKEIRNYPKDCFDVLEPCKNFNLEGFSVSNMEPSGVLKGAASSNTTQNVLAGGVAGGGAVLVGLSALRSWAPNLIPWSPEHDAELVVFATTILVPFASRAIAFWRQPAKAGK